MTTCSARTGRGAAGIESSGVAMVFVSCPGSWRRFYRTGRADGNPPMTGANDECRPRDGAALSSHSGRRVTMATDAAREASSKNDELINADLIRQWLASRLGWLLLFPTSRGFASPKFTYPGFFGPSAWLPLRRL